MAKRAPKTLYHYCSIETFFNIMKSNSIWLSDIQQSNDSLELSYMKSFYGTLVNNATTEFMRNHIEKGQRYNGWELATLLEVFTTPSLLQVTKSWGFCLSEKGDLLSQWRGYADDGLGVSIGFNRNYLAAGVDTLTGELPSNDTDAVGLIQFKKVDYSLKHVQHRVEEIFNPTECGQCETLNEFREKLQAPLYLIDIEAPYYKHDSFKEECEWRIALNFIIGSTCAYSNINIKTDTLSLGHFDYIPSHKKLISHFELNLGNMRKAIDCIILGPKCKVSITEMQHYLVSLGILKSIDDNSVKVIASSSSYR